MPIWKTCALSFQNCAKIISVSFSLNLIANQTECDKQNKKTGSLTSTQFTATLLSAIEAFRSSCVQV